MLGIVHAQVNNPALPNTLRNMSGPEFTGNLISSFISLALIIGGIMLLAMLIVGGIKWITSEGDKIKLESARKTIAHAIIGIVILFSFFAISNLLSYFFCIDFFHIQVAEFNIGFQESPYCSQTPNCTPLHGACGPGLPPCCQGSSCHGGTCGIGGPII